MKLWSKNSTLYLNDALLHPWCFLFDFLRFSFNLKDLFHHRRIEKKKKQHCKWKNLNSSSICNNTLFALLPVVFLFTHGAQFTHSKAYGERSKLFSLPLKTVFLENSIAFSPHRCATISYSVIICQPSTRCNKICIHCEFQFD